MPRRKDEEKLVTSLPRIGLVMFPYANHYTFISEGRGNVLEARRLDATSSVKKMVYSKSKSSASGNFTVDLTSDQSWDRVVRPGDWVMLYLSRFGINTKTTKGLICLGNIDRVSRRKSTTRDGKKFFTYRISGRDFGKIFDKSKFYYNPYVPKSVQNNFVILKKGFKITGSPAEFLQSYLNLYFGDGLVVQLSATKKKQKIKSDQFNQVRLPKPVYDAFGVRKSTGKFSDILRVEIGGADTSLVPEGYSWAIPSERAINGSLWDIIVSISNSLMNEVYLSMKYYPAEDRVFPTLTLRKLPYSQTIFPKLPNIRIQENQILSDDLGFSDHERYNWINFDPQAPRMDGYSQFMAAFEGETIPDPFALDGTKTPLFPFINKASIIRHGLNQFQASTEFFFISGADKKQARVKTDLDIVKRWQKELIEWWSNYDRTENGTMIIKGYSEINDIHVPLSNTTPILVNDKPLKTTPPKENLKSGSIATDHLNIGENVYLNSREKLYQLEGVSHEWSAPGQSTSTLTVIRGVSWTRGQSRFKYLDDVDFKTRDKITGAVDQTEIGLTIIKRKKK